MFKSNRGALGNDGEIIKDIVEYGEIEYLRQLQKS